MIDDFEEFFDAVNERRAEEGRPPVSRAKLRLQDGLLKFAFMVGTVGLLCLFLYGCLQTNGIGCGGHSCLQ